MTTWLGIRLSNLDPGGGGLDPWKWVGGSEYVLSLIKCHIHSSKNCCWDYCKFHIIKDERRVSKLEGKTNLGAWNSLTAWPDWPWSPYLTTDLRHCYWPKGVIMISESFALQLELLMDCRRCWFWDDLFKSRIDRFCKYHDVRYDYKTEPTGKWVESLYHCVAFVADVHCTEGPSDLTVNCCAVSHSDMMGVSCSAPCECTCVCMYRVYQKSFSWRILLFFKNYREV